MRRQTRKMLLNFATGAAVAATAMVVFLPAAQAQSASATATASVNVRAGPGTSFAVVDTLRPGQRVDIDRCQGSWCYVVKTGPDGWVSANYLARGQGGGDRLVGPSRGQQPSVNFGFSVGPDGPSFNIGVGDQNRQRQQVACFYENRNYRGENFCLRRGQTYQLPRRSDGIGSIENRAGYSVEVCAGFRGRDCRTYTTSASSLGFFGQDVTRVRVR